MSLREVHGGRALVLRLVLAELIAKRGEGPLAPRFARVPSRAERTPRIEPEAHAGLRSGKEPA